MCSWKPIQCLIMYVVSLLQISALCYNMRPFYFRFIFSLQPFEYSVHNDILEHDIIMWQYLLCNVLNYDHIQENRVWHIHNDYAIMFLHKTGKQTRASVLLNNMHPILVTCLHCTCLIIK